MPEYKVPSIEPLHIDKLIAGDGIGITVTTTNIEVYGCSNFTINRMDADLPGCKFDFDISFDHLKITGKYNIDGRILLIPIKGQGTMGSDVYDAKAKCSLKCELFKEKGSNDDFAHFTGLEMAIDVNKGKLHLDNLFGNERLLGEVINTAINLNFRQFIEELKPLIQKTLSEFMLVTANNIISGYTYETVFPN
ncbi:hypothetical protein AAG570_000529 [Ranatra chinensis]|uniref:Uncharacterized protein n=1 Tax=Ranatra chinensis TaxID=642074 RepID=A0ABD0YZE4_9HEMI